MMPHDDSCARGGQCRSTSPSTSTNPLFEQEAEHADEDEQAVDLRRLVFALGAHDQAADAGQPREHLHQQRHDDGERDRDPHAEEEARHDGGRHDLAHRRQEELLIASDLLAEHNREASFGTMLSVPSAFMPMGSSSWPARGRVAPFGLMMSSSLAFSKSISACDLDVLNRAAGYAG